MPVIEMTKLRWKLLNNLDPVTQKPVPQWKVAAACEMNQDSMSLYAQGRQPYHQRDLHALCRYFDCEPAELAGWCEVMIPDDEVSTG